MSIIYSSLLVRIGLDEVILALGYIATRLGCLGLDRTRFCASGDQRVASPMAAGLQCTACSGVWQGSVAVVRVEQASKQQRQQQHWLDHSVRNISHLTHLVRARLGESHSLATLVADCSVARWALVSVPLCAFCAPSAPTD